MSSNRIAHARGTYFELVEGIDTITGELLVNEHDEPGVVRFEVGQTLPAPLVTYDLRTGRAGLYPADGFVPMSVEAWLDALELATPDLLDAFAAAASRAAAETVEDAEASAERARGYVRQAELEAADFRKDVADELDRARAAECLRFALQLPAASRSAALAMLPSWRGSAVDLVAAARGVVAPAA